MWYGGMARGARDNDGNPTQWYVTREADGSSALSQQNAAVTSNLCWAPACQGMEVFPTEPIREQNIKAQRNVATKTYEDETDDAP